MKTSRIDGPEAFRPHGTDRWRLRLRRALFVPLLASLVVLSACTSSDSSLPADATAESVDSDELRDASSVRAGLALSGQTFEIGEVALVGDLSVVVTELVFGGDDLGPWLAATTRVENRSERDSTVPYMAVRCHGNEEPGSWQVDSTLMLGELLPARSVDSGVVHLLAPGDGHFGAQRPLCQTPAVIRVDTLGVNIAVPDSLVEQLNNAAPAAVGDASGSGSGDSPNPGSDDESSPQPVSGDLFSLVDAINASGLTCNGPALIPPDQESFFGLVPPDMEVECVSPEVGKVVFTTWPNPQTLRGVARVFIEVAAAVGIDNSQVDVIVLSGVNAVWIDPVDMNDPRLRPWMASVQRVIGGKIMTLSELAGL